MILNLVKYLHNYYNEDSMSRFSIEKNMIAPVDSATAVTNSVLTFPNTFEKFTIGLDRDGVLNEIAAVIKTPDQFIPINNSLRAVAIMRSLGHKIAILYDQPLISQRKITIPEVEDINQHMLMLLGQAGCTSIDGIYYSTSNKKEDIYAKPKTGMFSHAESTLPGVKFKGGAYVGDSIEDLLMADKAGATPILVLTGNGLKTLAKLKTPIYTMLRPKVRVFEDLYSYASSLV